MAHFAFIAIIVIVAVACKYISDLAGPIVEYRFENVENNKKINNLFDK